jgi:hypothetical protein
MMTTDPIPALISQVDQEKISGNLFYLSKDPLPYRKLNYTIPGHTANTLYEADDFIASKLESWGYNVEREGCRVQAFRRDTSKPIRSQFAAPEPEDPWYTAYNIYAKKQGETYPDEIMIFISHKDSQSWIDSPGAYDNAVGTVANMEIARILSDYPSQRSIWFIFCNEEHRPWTSVTAANNAKERGDNIIAVFNLDGLGGKSQEDIDAGQKTNTTLYTTPDGEHLADLMAEVNETYKIGLIQQKCQRKSPGDDDGSYVKAGYTVAVANIGSYPYADPNYHDEGDIPELVDLPNLRMSTQASLAAGVRVDLGVR